MFFSELWMTIRVCITGLDASDQVRAGLGSMPGSAGKQGYGWSPELSLKSVTLSWSTFEGWTQLEHPELRFLSSALVLR